MVDGDNNLRDPVRKPLEDELRRFDRSSANERDFLHLRDSDLLAPSWSQKGWSDKGWSDKGWSNKGWTDNGWSGGGDESESGRSLSIEAWFGSSRDRAKPWSPSGEQTELLKQLAGSSPNPKLIDSALLEKPGELSAWQVAAEIKKLMPKLDADHDGAIDFNELGRAVKDRSFTGSAAQALAGLYSARERIADPSKDGPKITDASLAKLAQLKDVAELEPAMVAISRTAKLLSNKDIFPGDENGVLSRESLEKGRHLVASKDLQLLEFAMAHFDQLKQLGASFAPKGADESAQTAGLSRQELSKLSSLPNQFSSLKTMHELSQVLDSAAYVQQIDSSTLFNGNYGFMNLFHQNAVVPDAVQEGIIHDCKLDGPLAALANVDSQAIKKMITADPSGDKFTVTFPGAPQEPVTVDAPSQAELALFNQSGPFGVWANVIEKAYGEYVRSHLDQFRKTCSDGDPAAQCLEDGGLWDETRLLTGHSASGYQLDREDSAEIKRALTDGVNNKSVITMASIDGPADKRVSNSHLYAVLDYDPKGADGGTLTVYDPYGKRSLSGDGHFTVSFNKLFDDFTWIAIEQQWQRKHQT